jgi:hypothetical protein
VAGAGDAEYDERRSHSSAGLTAGRCLPLFIAAAVNEKLVVQGSDAGGKGERAMRMRAMSTLPTIAALVFVLNVTQADDIPNATIELSGGSIAAGIGVSWGSGTLTYEGKTYPISVTGLSIGEVGATKVEASGDVYNLERLEDFDGNYVAAAVGAAAIAGGSAVAMKNQNGVTVKLVTITQGLKLVVAVAGVNMKIKK